MPPPGSALYFLRAWMPMRPCNQPTNQLVRAGRVGISRKTYCECCRRDTLAAACGPGARGTYQRLRYRLRSGLRSTWSWCVVGRGVNAMRCHAMPWWRRVLPTGCQDTAAKPPLRGEEKNRSRRGSLDITRHDGARRRRRSTRCGFTNAISGMSFSSAVPRLRRLFSLRSFYSPSQLL